MEKIGLLEDREEMRQTLLAGINIALPQGWSCVEVPFFSDPDSYAGWLVSEGICVLIADFRLNEEGSNGQKPVDYMADKVIDCIRTKLPDYPIYILTAVPDHGDLRNKDADTEFVMRRAEFVKDPKPYLRRMVRAGCRFADQFSAMLAELGKLSAKEARGMASGEEKDRILAIQTLIGFGDVSTADYDRDAMLDELDAKIKSLEAIKDQLQNLLKAQ